jgi:hypothetical protein
VSIDTTCSRIAIVCLNVLITFLARDCASEPCREGQGNETTIPANPKCGLSISLDTAHATSFTYVCYDGPGCLSTREMGTEMAILIVGASGATGKLLVEQLLERGQEVRIIVRSTGNLSTNVVHHNNLTVTLANILDLSDKQLRELVAGCDAVASCLGHNLSFKGMLGAPHRLVTEATQHLCAAVKANNPSAPVKFVLMNTTGNRNRDLDEQVSFAHSCVIGLLRLLLPPHVDNEKAADYLRTEIGQHNQTIEWVVVRPDSLLDETGSSEFTVHPSPTRCAIFDSGVTSRSNVARFMADLVISDPTWVEWKGKMPVIYNQ